MAIIILSILLLHLIAAVSDVSMFLSIKRVWQQLTVKLRFKTTPDVFDGNYLDAKAFYMREFKQIPCFTFMGSLDVNKAFDYIQKGNAGKVLAVYQRNWFNWDEKKLEFSKTVFKLENKVIIKLGDSYAEILFAKNNFSFSNQLVEKWKAFSAPAKEREYEINIITLTRDGLELKQLAIKPVELDIALYYNNDFKAVDKTIKERLAKENDKGIILLHGLPGTGKTTYLRHLIGSLKKKVLFVSPGVAGNLMNPEFIDLLIDNPNAVLVIEDAENIIMDRRYSNGSSVSNLLNISDGLLSDCLNVQVICTFNSDLHLIDSALLRKGRLIAKYEFGKLEIAKARKLSEHLGLTQEINKPLTLAEITHPEETHYKPVHTQVIGFRRELEELETS